MAAFIIAGIGVVLTLLATLAYVFGNAMNDATGNNLNPWPIFIGGLSISALIAASHWLPHIGW